MQSAFHRLFRTGALAAILIVALCGSLLWSAADPAAGSPGPQKQAAAVAHHARSSAALVSSKTSAGRAGDLLTANNVAGRTIVAAPSVCHGNIADTSPDAESLLSLSRRSGRAPPSVLS